MKRLRRASLALGWLLVLGLGLSGSATARAQAGGTQAWLPDRVRGDGQGFRTDRVEIHPSFAAEAAYDSNIFLQDLNPRPTAVMRLTAGVVIQPRRADGDTADGNRDDAAQRRLDFNLGLVGSYYHYFTPTASDNVGGTFNAGIRVRPEGRVGFSLRESFDRTVRPFTDAARGATANYSYGRNTSSTTAAVTFQSRGGVVRGQVGYTARIGFFDSTLFRVNNSFQNDVGFRLAWTFFPRTALVHETNVIFNQYGLGGGDVSFAALSSSRRVESTVALNGVLTPKLMATVSLGYAAGFYSSGPEYDGLIARAELRYRPRPAMTYTLGYQHDYQLAYIGNFEQRDIGYANAEMAFAGRFVAGGQISVGYSQSGTAFLSDGVTPLGNYVARFDTRAMVRAYFEYRPTSFLALTLNTEYIGDFTPYAFNTPAGAGSLLPDPSAAYQRFDAWLGVRVFH